MRDVTWGLKLGPRCQGERGFGHDITIRLSWGEITLHAGRHSTVASLTV